MLHIALLGKGRSGKGSAAAYLESRYGMTRATIAAPSKRAVGRLIQNWTGDFSRDPLDVCEQWKDQGTTVRPVLQGLAEVLAEVAPADTLVADLVIRAQEAGVPVVVDDCRMPWEADLFHAAGWVVIALDRPGNDVPAIHGHQRTEGLIDQCYRDWNVRNDRDLAHMYGQLDMLVAMHSAADLTPRMCPDPGALGEFLRDLSGLPRVRRVA